MARQIGRINLSLIFGMLLPVGCTTPVYLIDRATVAKVRCTADDDCNQVGIPAVEESPRHRIVARNATFQTLQGKTEILDYSTVVELPTSGSEDSPPPDSLMRVRGRGIPSSAWDNGARGLTIGGGMLLAAALIGAGGALWISAASGSSSDCSSSYCSMRPGYAELFAGGIGAGSALLFGVPGIVMLTVGLSRQGKQKYVLQHLKVMNPP